MHCWPRYLLWLVIVVLGTSSMLTACGQKGPLYLPDPATETQQAADQGNPEAKPKNSE
jgi:predicted small lipoprotein YifL